MEDINFKIKALSKELALYKTLQKESIASVVEARKEGCFVNFKDTCDQILHLIGGYKWDFYNNRFTLRRDIQIKTNNYYDICYIYDRTGFGSSIGFVCTEEFLFLATRFYHRDMWIFRIKDSWEKENRSFEDFSSNLEKDINFLKDCFKNYITSKKESAYLQAYENRKLKIKKHYIFQEYNLED
jgi:hypothetical protein